MDGLQQPWNRFYHCHPSQIYDKMRWDFSKIQSRRTHSISYSKFPRLVSVKKLIDDFWSNKQKNVNYFFETKRNEMKKKTIFVRGLRRLLQRERAANDLNTLISTKRIEKRCASFRNTNDNQEIGNMWDGTSTMIEFSFFISRPNDEGSNIFSYANSYTKK